MTRYIAFLRAINVGGRNVKMDELRRLFEALGFANVETFIASGNVVFDSVDMDEESLTRKIESHLKDSLGYEVATFLRSAPELASVSRHQPFPQAQIDSSAALNVAFLAKPLDELQIQKLMALQTEIDTFHVNKREIYWLCLKKQIESTFSNALLEKTLKVKSTLRGISTVQKMVEKYC
jgi:uncharacterized protein (DUF1697 family)